MSIVYKIQNELDKYKYTATSATNAIFNIFFFKKQFTF